MKTLDGNVTIITGAGKGIGFGLAEDFPRRKRSQTIRHENKWRPDRAAILVL